MSLFHKHNWRYTGAEVLEVNPKEDGKFERRYTLIHRVCFCGKFTVLHLEGKWTLSEIRDMPMNELKK